MAAHSPGPSAGCGGRPAVPAGVSDQTLVSDGVERVYQLDLPASYDGTTPLPIVLGLHALSISHTFVSGTSGFPQMADTYDFIAVTPSGRLNGATPYWNAAPVDDNYDVQFIDELLDHLEATLCVDTGRVFSTGMSNGAQMSSLLACRLPERIAAIGAVAGVEFLEPCDGAPVPVVAFHGTDDPVLPYAGGGLNATRIAELNFYADGLPDGLPEPLGVDESMARWAAYNGCSAEPVDERVSPEVRRRTWPDCEAATVLYIVDGGGHTWPGKRFPQFESMFGATTTDIDATSLIFELFFEEGEPAA
ncbi:MAG: PHB depolymerase family esterase [Acidimicrobiales bacterium]